MPDTLEMPSRSPARRPPDGPARGAALDAVGLALAILLFAVLGLWQLRLPGLYQDEALDVAPAVRLLKGYAPWPYSLCPATLGLPLMVCDHVGPTSTYLMLPFLRVFGIGVIGVRAYEFAVGLAALVFIFIWARRVLAPGTAWIAALLLAATPSFWLACRNGLHVSFIVIPLAAAALVCLDRWRRGGTSRWLYLASFLLGVGLSTKILFIWFLAALAAGMLIAPRSLVRKLGRWQIAASITCFIIGCGPFVAFVALSRGLTIRTILTNLTHTTYGVRNADVLTNLMTQFRSFAHLLDGSWLTWTGISPQNPAALPLFLVSAVCLAFHWRERETGLLRFSLMAIAVMVLASCFTITTLGPKHLVILLPFTTVIIAAAIGRAWSKRRRRGSLAILVLLVALAAAQLTADIGNDRRYLRSLAATGGVGLFSSAHSDLATYLMANGVAHPLAGDWGFDSNLEVLSQGRVRVRQIFELTEAPPYQFTRQQARGALRSRESVFLFHAEPISATPGRFQAVAAVAREMGVDLKLAAAFRDGRGRPVAFVYRPSAAEPTKAPTGPGDGT